ncbi:MAG: glycosyltransferase [Acidobacteria bacterium]|nr:glycosyltransferase [Acidobacteriota bacterium]
MRILHVADRLSDRGGADLALLGLLDALARPPGRVGSLRAREASASPVVRRSLLAAGHEQHLAVGHDDGVVRPPCPVTVVPGLDARTRVGSPSRGRRSLRARGAPGIARPAAQTPSPPFVAGTAGRAAASARRPAQSFRNPPRSAAQTPGAELDALLERLRPDVVHVHNVVNPAVLAWAAGVDAVVTIQDHRFFCPGRGKWTADGRVCGEAMGRETCAGCFDDRGYFEAVLALTAERLDAVRRLRLTVLSRYMKRELVQAGIPAARISVVPPVAYGLDRDAEADGPPCVLFAGRVVEAKGIREAIDAWRRSGCRLPFVVAGTGPLRREIEAEGVEVLGWLDRRRLSAAYRRAAVVVMPSRWQEPFGIVGLEALTLGTPVAAWDSGGVREWHPGGELLVPWGDIDGLAAALRRAPGQAVDSPPGFAPHDHVRRLEALYGGPATPRRRWTQARSV